MAETKSAADGVNLRRSEARPRTRRILLALVCAVIVVVTAAVFAMIANSDPATRIQAAFTTYLMTAVPGATVKRDKDGVVTARYRTMMYTTKAYYNGKVYLNQQEGPRPGGFLVRVWASQGYRREQLAGTVLDCEFPGGVAVGIKRTFARAAPPGVTPAVIYVYAFYPVAPHVRFDVGGFGPEPPMPPVVAHLLEIARKTQH